MSKIILYDNNKSVTDALKIAFKGISDVEVQNISFEDLRSDYVVTAGNSYGWMTGGLDLAVRNYYGQQVQDAIQEKIIFDYNGYLPVGEVVSIYTYDEKKPFLIYTPTMEKPKPIEIEDVLYVSMTLFNLAFRLGLRDKTFAICGLGTATGEIKPNEFAWALRKAYDLEKEWKEDTERNCDTCRKRKTMDCPNSSECYETDNKPYYEKKEEKYEQ